MSDKHQVLTNIWPLRLVVNPFFFVTFHITKNGFAISKTGMVVGFCSLSVTLLYKIYSIFENPSRKFEEYVENYGSLAPALLCVLSYLGYLTQSDSIVEVLNNILSGSLFLDKRFVKRIYRLTKLQVLLCHVLPFSSAVWVSYHFYMETIQFQAFITNALFDYFVMIHFAATCLVFSNATLFCHRLIKKTNEKLLRLGSVETEPSSERLFGKQGKVSTILVASVNDFSVSAILNYDKICELCLDFNRRLGGPLAACCTCNLIGLILYSYYLTKYGIVELWMFAFISSYCFLEIWVILYVCEKFKAEVQKTGVIVSRLIMETKNQQLKELLQQFSHLLLHRKINFTACGMFPLDYTLIYSALATVATYLAIAFQFEYASRSSNRNAMRQPMPVSLNNSS